MLLKKRSCINILLRTYKFLLTILIKKILTKNVLRKIQMKKVLVKYLSKINQTIFHTYKTSAKYYQKNKERLQKVTGERYQNLSKEKKTKSENMHVKDIKIFLKKGKIKNNSIVVNTVKCFLEMKDDGYQNIGEITIYHIKNEISIF